jgi:hypothetical protein
VVKDYLICNGFVETFKEVFCDPSTSETIRNYCVGDSNNLILEPPSNELTSKPNTTCAQLFDEYKPKLFDIENRKKI